MKKLAAAALLGAALFAVPEPAEAQSGCELLYLKWEGCATECDSYYESTVLRAVCRGWCLVEYLYDYWTCESNVEGAATADDEAGESPAEEPPNEEPPNEEPPNEESPNEESPNDESHNEESHNEESRADESLNGEASAVLFFRGGSGFAPVAPSPPGEISPTDLAGTSRPIFRRAVLRPCAADSAPLRQAASEPAPAVAALAPRASSRDARMARRARRTATEAEKK